MTQIPTPTTLLSGGLVFPEGPRWHDGRLYFADIHGHQVVWVDLDGNSGSAGRVDRPNGLGFMPDGTLLALAMHIRTIFEVAGDDTKPYVDFGDLGGDFINDMVTDDEGFSYVGLRSIRQPGSPPPVTDRVVLVRPDRSKEVVAEGMTSPNGMVLTEDGNTLIVAETQALRLTAFDRTPSGGLTNKRTFAQLDPDLIGEGKPPFPDGIALDASGAVWVGTAMSGEYLRVAEGGEILDRFHPNAAWATACIFGGDDRKLLFLATCDGSMHALDTFRHRGMDQEGDREEYMAFATGLSQGFIEYVELPVGGAGRP